MPKLKRCRSKLCLLLGGDLNNSNRIGSAIDGDISKADQGNSAINCFIINIHIDDFAILEIKVLLQSTDLTMQDIADQLGFPDQSYLGRYFKRHEGISPREYQNKYAM